MRVCAAAAMLALAGCYYAGGSTVGWAPGRGVVVGWEAGLGSVIGFEGSQSWRRVRDGWERVDYGGIAGALPSGAEGVVAVGRVGAGVSTVGDAESGAWRVGGGAAWMGGNGCGGAWAADATVALRWQGGAYEVVLTPRVAYVVVTDCDGPSR